MMTCIAIGGGKAAPRRLLSCTARVIFRPAFPQGLSREGKLCAYHLPLETYGFQTAQRDMMPCIAIVYGCTVPFPCRLPSRAFRQNPHKKREARFGASLMSVSGGIRTRDLQSRSLTRYPAALQTQSTLLLYLVLRRRARLSFTPVCSACAPPVSRSAPGRRAALPPPSRGSRGRSEGAAPLPCGRGVSLPPRSSVRPQPAASSS